MIVGSVLLTAAQSIWSIQNGPSNPTTLIYVAVIVGLVTYLIVFNLNLIVSSCARSYRRVKDRLVRKMRQDEHERWRQRGADFNVFRPVHEREKPTEWLLLLYALWLTYTSVWRRTKGEHGEGSSPSAEDLDG